MTPPPAWLAVKRCARRAVELLTAPAPRRRVESSLRFHARQNLSRGWDGPTSWDPASGQYRKWGHDGGR
jgi:hypothetical protein